jgi:alkylation response protein AidB-like acyl-CoA dehydrogenase
MDLRLSAEQEALRDSVAQVVERLAPKAVADLEDAERAEKLDAAVEASGWRELRSASNGDEPLASGVEVAIVAEELGRGVADAAFMGPTLAADLRRLVGAAGATATETVALSADLGALDGHVAVDAAGATAALSLAGSEIVQVPVTGPIGEPVDLTRPSCAIGPVSTPVGVVATDDLTRWTALGLALTCADLVGTMRGAIEMTRSYANERRQYGMEIGSFQAVQHLLADAHVTMEGSRSIALHAAWAVDALAPADALAAAAAAKAYCARGARSVCETAIQVHGGIGNTWEHMAHVFLRRVLLSSDVLGGVGPSLERVAHHHGIGGSDGLR